MPWNPETYHQFKNERFAPAFDLISHIEFGKNLQILDLGCGTGELTKIISEYKTSNFTLGVDNSPEMLNLSTNNVNLHFELKDIEDILLEDRNWDIIFANASLQWVDNHKMLFTKMITKLKDGGQIAIQMPCQRENKLNQLLSEIIKMEPFVTALNHFESISPLLSMDDYAQLFFEHQAKVINIYQKVYPIIAQSHSQLFDFISGSALIPYNEKLTIEMNELLKKEFLQKIENSFGTVPVLYAFKRIIIYGKF